VDGPKSEEEDDNGVWIERYDSDSDSWFLVYCDCKGCQCINKYTKVREKTPDGRVIYWCTYCFSNHREKP
jgi:hypothetical protein